MPQENQAPRAPKDQLLELYRKRQELLLQKKAMIQQRRDAALSATEPKEVAKDPDANLPPSPRIKTLGGPGSPQLDFTARDVGKTVASALPGIGSAAGIAIGGATGGAGGAGAGMVGGSIGGAALKSQVQKNFPELFGNPSSDTLFVHTGDPAIDAAAEDIIINAATLGAGKTVQLIRNKNHLMGKLVRTIGETLDPTAIQAAKDLDQLGYEPIEWTVGTKGGLARYIEDILVPGAKAARQRKQLDAVLGNLEKATNIKFNQIPSIKETSSKSILDSYTNLSTLKTNEITAKTAARNRFPKMIVESLDPDNPRTLRINNAVTARKTHTIAASISSQLAPFFDEGNVSAVLPDTLKAKLSHIKSFADSLSGQVAIKNKGGDASILPVQEFDKLMYVYEELASMTSIKSKGANQLRNFPKDVGSAELYIEDTANTLANAIRNDLKTSQGSIAGERVSELFAAKDKLYKTYPPELLNALNGDVSDLFNKALASPEMARSLARSSGSQRNIESELLSRFMDKYVHGTGEEKIFDAAKALEDFKSRKFEGMAELIGGKRRQNIINILEVAKNVHPELAMTGQVAVGIRYGGAQINVATKLIQALGSPFKVGVAGGAAGALIGGVGGALTGTGAAVIGIHFVGRKFAERVLLDPHWGKVAAGLMKAPTKSSLSYKDTAKLLGVMKGTEAILTFMDEKGNQVAEPQQMILGQEAQ